MKALTEDFLYELYGSAMSNEKIAALVATHVENSYLPNKHYQKINTVFSDYWKIHKEPPSYGILSQMLTGEARCLSMLNDFKVYDEPNVEAIAETLERYIIDVKLKQAIEQSVRAHNAGESDKACNVIAEYADWKSTFSLKPSTMIDILGTYESRYYQNLKNIQSEKAKQAPLYRMYIDYLDKINENKNLRGQLSMFLASSGVGKSHIARHIGQCGCVDDGLDVLHLQLEGSASEVADAYSASLAGFNAWYYEQGEIPEDAFEETLKIIKTLKGTIMVKSFSKFGMTVTPRTVYGAIDEFIDSVGKAPDIVIIDSGDLMTEDTKSKRTKGELRHALLHIVQDLKDIAGEKNCWVIVTYQATIESPDFLNNEQNVLTRYHISESKGTVRPLTHLISLNQTDAEKEEKKMRIHIDKGRFWRVTKPTFSIKTDYDNGLFYDSAATLRLEM